MKQWVIVELFKNIATALEIHPATEILGYGCWALMRRNQALLTGPPWPNMGRKLHKDGESGVAWVTIDGQGICHN
jgi:hypothetical protein